MSEICFKLAIMFRNSLFSMLALLLFLSPLMAEETNEAVKRTHIHFEHGLLYCDVQVFNQEAYILKVLGGGSPLTVYWEFEVFEQRKLWLDASKGVIRLGKQVIPDLVVKRWLMRDLSSGVVQYTVDIQLAMQFLTVLDRAAVIDTSLLSPDVDYLLAADLYMYEAEKEEHGWWLFNMNQGIDMGEVHFRLSQDGE